MNQQEPERHLDSRSFDDTHLHDEKFKDRKGSAAGGMKRRQH
jgi:hypothetical protein